MKKHILDTFSLLDKKQKRDFFIIILLIFFGSLLEFLSLFTIYQTIKFFSNTQAFVLEQSYFKDILNFLFNDPNSLFNFIILLISIYFLKFFYFAIMYYKQFKYSAYITYKLSTKLLNQYLKNNFKFHTESETSKLMRNVKDEVGQFGIGGVQQLIILMNELIVLLVILALLAYHETEFLIIIFSFFMIIGSIYYLIVKSFFNKYGKIRQFYASKIMKYSLESLYGIKNIKLFNVRSFFLEKYKLNAKKLADAQRIITTLNQIPRIGLELLTVIVICFVLYFIFKPGQFDSQILPSVGLFILAAFKIIPSISRILNSLNLLRYSYPSTLEIKKELNRKIPIDEDTDKLNTKLLFKEKIKFENVSFDFKNRKKILLKNINLEIKKNSSIGIMGDSGSGKSTLIDLLIGLYEPNGGNIFVDGININKVKNSWKKKICLVPQKIFMLNDSIKNNIAFGIDEENINHEMIEEAINLSQLKEFINKLPDGKNTIIGDRGIEISGGEQQRIGIARAFYRNSEVIILDEFTSGLDRNNEETLMSLIKSFVGKKTLIIISHKKDLLSFCEEKYLINSSKLTNI